MNDLRHHFERMKGEFRDVVAPDGAAQRPWNPILISAGEINAEIERLAALPAPAKRESLVVHPLSRPDTPGLAPGIQVKLSVLKPGESSSPLRHNATEVNFCIRGGGHTLIANRRIDFRQYDVWNHPSYALYQHFNDTAELQVRLTYSNTPLLQHMGVYIVDAELRQRSSPPTPSGSEPAGADSRRRNPFGLFDLGGGALMMPYETLINPPPVASSALHWSWGKVKKELDKLEALGQEYIGRRLYLLYNPKTGSTNGTTPSFFATITVRPPRIVDRPHRHVSAAINYYFSGRGYSVVAGNRYEWRAGDLMLSAPGWVVHNHAAYDEPVYELTVQDQPLNLAMESLLWQENMRLPAVVLGVESGFSTNRADVTP